MALILPPNGCYFFFADPSSEYTPTLLKQQLRDARFTVTGRKEPFKVRWQDGPEFFVSITRGDFVETVVRSLMGPRRKYRRMIPGLDTYVLLQFADLDEVLDEINSLIELQTALQEGTRGLMYLSWNHHFSGPED